MLGKWVKRIILPVNWVSISLIAVMMLLTTADAVGRYCFDKPVKGALELTQVMLAIIVFGTMAYAALNKRHISVDVIVSRLPQRMQAVFGSFNSLLSLAFFALLTWQSIVLSNFMWAKGDTLLVIGWPLWPFPAFVALGSFLVCLVLVTHFGKHVALTWTGRWRVRLAFFFGLAVFLLLLAVAVWGHGLPWQISWTMVGVIGMIFMLVIMFCGVWIGVAFGFAGILGIAYLVDLTSAVSLLGTDTFATVAYYGFACAPLFILMGEFASYAGLSQELYKAAYTWLGRLPGGLAMASVAACAGFASVSGSSVATAVTMGRVAIPEMRRYNYDRGLAAGVVASAGTMGILIPPSIVLIVYGIIAEQSIGKLFMAGIIPGILEAVFYIITIYVLCKRNPMMGPPGPGASFMAKMTASKGTLPVLALFLLVIGGMYLGIFTPTEAAGIGAFGALVVAMARRKINCGTLYESLSQTGQTTAMVFLFIVGATLLGYFLGLSRLAYDLAEFIAGLQVSRYLIIAGVMVLFLILGCFLDVAAMIVITVPIFVPVIIKIGFDPIWFGIVMVRMSEIGAITPPVGLNVFVVKGVAPDIPLGEIFRGVTPFFISDLCHVTMLILVPQVALFLPSMMYQ